MPTEIMRPIEGSSNFWYLVRNGPSLIKELPADKLSLDDRHYYDIRRFDALRRLGGYFERHEAVFYLHGYHDPGRVLRRYLVVNKERLENHGLSRRSVKGALPDPFAEAWGEIASEFGWIKNDPPTDGGRDESYSEEPLQCPVCGEEEVTMDLPRHLRTECPATQG